MELHWTWYALAIVGAYRMITVCFEAVVRRTIHIARQSTTAEPVTSPVRTPRGPIAPPPGAVQPLYRELHPGFAPAQGEGQGER
ncbi:hypothetical protein [Streptomyces sp. NPDC006551]|uniref:hypothetical protein n=1 Tax=Streptomyces sp. NPDC006551 TaxID=3157178 RepID=UPI0033AD342C